MTRRARTARHRRVAHLHIASHGFGIDPDADELFRTSEHEIRCEARRLELGNASSTYVNRPVIRGSR